MKRQEKRNGREQEGKSEKAERKRSMKEYCAAFVMNKKGTTKQKGDHCAPLPILCTYPSFPCPAGSRSTPKELQSLVFPFPLEEFPADTYQQDIPTPH